jgi:phosphohistidine phosphatase
MKQLCILRHSKAGHTNKRLLDDHERELTDKGISLCSPMAAFMQKKLEKPDNVLCSTSVRTKQTLEKIIEHTGWQIQTEYLQSLYLASLSDLYSIIHAVPDTVNNLLIVGHNPGLHQLAIDLAGKGDKKLFREMRNHFSPPSLAAYAFAVESWGLVTAKSGELKNYVQGKEI